MAKTRRKPTDDDAERSRPRVAFPDAEGRDTIHKFDAKLVVRIGVDTNDGPEHILYSNTSRNMTPNRQMIDSIKVKGVKTPGWVRKNGPRAELIVGRRRLLNLRIANEELVAEGHEPWPFPAMQFRGTEAEMLELLMLENVEREDELDVELARQAVKLLALGRTREQVANRCGFDSVGALNELIKVLDLAPEVQEHVGPKRLFSRSAAVAMVDVDFKRQKEILAEAQAQAEAGIKPSARSVRAAASPDAVVKPTAKQWKRVVEVMRKDLVKPGAQRHFEVNTETLKYAIDLIRVFRGEIAARGVKGLVAALDGRVALE
jgi:ParB-like chromosome segregation protein Spo0J